jgi:hypothetical protein
MSAWFIYSLATASGASGWVNCQRRRFSGQPHSSPQYSCRAAGPIRVKCEMAAPSGPSDQHRQNPSRLGPSSAWVAGRLVNLSLVAVVVELHNVGALLDALQLVEFFVETVASGADVV